MMAFFEDIFAYHHHINQQVIDALLEQETLLSARVEPLMAHTINAHQIWNARILNQEPFGVHQPHPLAVCKDLDRENYADTLRILNDFELQTKITYHNSKGQTFENTIQDILFHIANHTTHHRAQMVYELRQYGGVPPVTDYIFYKRA